jgi:hypothetical protein
MAGKKGFGRKSSAQDNFLAPLAPTDVTATDVGTSRAFNDGAATVSFSLPGNSPAATSYTATSSSGGYTATGSSSPLTVSGLQSDTSYTFTVTAENAQGTSPSSAASASITATTVPATPSAPSVSTVGGAAQDSVSWTAPANGGKAITGYTWSSSDSKSGSTASTSVTVNQEQGTSQTYAVYATNANGNSLVSANSASVTTFSFTPFSFAPFSVFGFSPFSFSPFSFAPFGVFGFSPFSVFGFSPFSFYQGGWSLEGATLVLTADGFVEAQTLQVGDILMSIDFDGIDVSNFDPLTWSTNDPLNVNNYVETTITQIKERLVENIVYINGEGFSDNHSILTRKNYESKFILSSEIDESYEIWSYATRDWAPVYNVEISPAPEGAKVYSINAEPYDIIITNGSIGYDADPGE